MMSGATKTRGELLWETINPDRGSETIMRTWRDSLSDRDRAFWEARAANFDASAWQSIETAPKDATVLGFGETCCDGVVMTAIEWCGKWTPVGQGSDSHEMRPTHWMPLPKAPGVEG